MPVLTVLLEQLCSPVPGGTGRWSEEVTRALVATAPPGWSVAGVVAAHRHPPRELAGVAVRPLPLPRPALARAWVRGVGPRVPGDVVLAPTLLAPTLRGARRSRLLVVAHDTVAFSHPGTLTPHGARWHRAATRAALRRATAVLAPSEVVVAGLRSLAPGSVVHRVGGGATAALRTPPADATARRAALGLPDRYVLGIGTVEPRKGWDVAVGALAQVLPARALVLVGAPGWGGVDLAEQALRLGVDLRLLGRCDDLDLAAVLHGAERLVAPSRAEGFGLPVLEALAAGVPVVHSADPALCELSAGRAEVVPVDDVAALAAVLASPPPAARPVDGAGWEDVARRVWDHAVGGSGPVTGGDGLGSSR